MANNPYVNKVVFGNSTLIDLSQDTATQADVAQGKYFHLPTGERVQGTASGGGTVVITDTQDSAGGTIREITATNALTLTTLNATSNQTYTAPSGTAYDEVVVDVSGGGGVEMFPVQIENATSSTFTAYYVNEDGSAHTQYPFVPGTITVYVPKTDVYYKAQTPLIWFTKASSVSLSVSAKGILCVSSDGTKCCIIPTAISTANTKITISNAT